jgi:hypothetical protein
MKVSPTNSEDTKTGENLTITFEVSKTPDEVFTAINNVRDWWSGEIDGDTNKLGDVWTYRYKDIHRSKQKITEFIPGNRVVWHVVDSYLSFIEDKEEWNGTDIVFEISRKGDKTKIRFTHIGLVPTIACYGKCAPAWDFYINNSLRKLILTGKGAPNTKE